MQEFFNNYPLLKTALVFLAILLVTVLVSRLLAAITRKVLARDDNPLPQSSIFVNIVRVGVWLIGISEILDLCFGVNATTVIAAMGIGGIAISLGCQDTLANLIGGLQVSMGRLVEPGQYIEVLGQQGRVVDTTWRHTGIIDTDGHEHLIPNQLINKNSLIHLTEAQTIKVPFLLPPGVDVAAFTSTVCASLEETMRAFVFPGAKPLVQFIGSEEGGLAGVAKLDIVRGCEGHDVARDQMARAIAAEIAPVQM